MPRLSRTKSVKLTVTSVKWKNQGHRRPCRRLASLQVEVHHRKEVHAPTALARGGVRRRKDQRVEVCRSLVDAGVPPGR